MYEAGKLIVATLADAEAFRRAEDAPNGVNEDEYFDLAYRLGYSVQYIVKEVGGPAVYLPHSCDEWVIGGPDQIRALIADLQAALVKIEDADGR